jgi:sulfite dehydrogenase (quinone) subunit SoeB
MTQLALVIDLNVCVGCHACVTSCKEWNTSGGPAPWPTTTPMTRTRPAPSSTACRPSRWASTRTPRRCTSRRAACTARTRPACRCARPAPATSARRHRAGGLRQVHRLQVLLLGLPLRRARARRAPEGDEEVHAVRGPHLRPACRKPSASRPACWPARPMRACSATCMTRIRRSRWRSARRGGYQLMPEWGTKPANHYLPRRKTRITIHEDELSAPTTR